MKPALLLLLTGMMGLAGCADLQRGAYRETGSINKYSRRNMAATANEVPLPRIHPRGVRPYAGYTPAYSSPSRSSYTGRQARLSSEKVPPPFSPGLYGPVADYPDVSPGFGGRRYRYGARNWSYGGYYPAY
jgi:hypothetical protein